MEKIHPLTDYFVNHLNNFERILFVEDIENLGVTEDVLKLKGLGKLRRLFFKSRQFMVQTWHFGVEKLQT